MLRVVGCGGLLTIALLMAVVVPFGAEPVADLPVGLVWFNAIDVLLWALWWLTGWSSNGVGGLIGGYRFLAQALAYELPLMFSLTAAGVAAGSLRMSTIVSAQRTGWFVLQMPVAALVFVGSLVTYSTSPPFSQPRGVDAAGGVASELSGVDRWLVIVGRYALLAVGCGMAAALFLRRPGRAAAAGLGVVVGEDARLAGGAARRRAAAAGADCRTGDAQRMAGAAAAYPRSGSGDVDHRSRKLMTSCL